MRIAIIGDYASQHFLIGKELEKQEYEVTYFLQNNKYANLPEHYFKLGSVQGPLWKNYLRTGFWMAFGKLLRKFDIQVVNGTYPQLVRASNTCFHYHGSDLRLGTVKPQEPSFVSLKELINYSPNSIFLPRCVNPYEFYSKKEVKEKKEQFKDENGFDYVIGHFAHSPKIKGSDLITEAIEEINNEKSFNIHFINKPIPRKKMCDTINFCDLIIDHANPSTGLTYNVISIEALFCDVSVGTYYSEQYIDYEEMKEVIGFLNPKNLKDSILQILKSETKKGKKDIALKYHSPANVTKVLHKHWKEWGFI